MFDAVLTLDSEVRIELFPFVSMRLRILPARIDLGRGYLTSKKSFPVVLPTAQKSSWSIAKALFLAVSLPWTSYTCRALQGDLRIVTIH